MDFRGYSISMELPDGIGNAIKVIWLLSEPVTRHV